MSAARSAVKTVSRALRPDFAEKSKNVGYFMSLSSVLICLGKNRGECLVVLRYDSRKVSQRRVLTPQSYLIVGCPPRLFRAVRAGFEVPPCGHRRFGFFFALD
jgi:hypothetical protein